MNHAKQLVEERRQELSVSLQPGEALVPITKPISRYGNWELGDGKGGCYQQPYQIDEVVVDWKIELISALVSKGKIRARLDDIT